MHEETLAQIAEKTLEHYNERADAFRASTWDHDVSQNIDAICSAVSSKNARKPAWILDFGCGPGRDLVEFTRRGFGAIGLDGSDRFVEMARVASACEVWQQDFLALALPSSRFDGIFANATLQHVPRSELPRVLGELRATLVPGGVLFASIPHGDDREGWNNGRYSAYHSPERWLEYLRSAGFEEIRHYYRPDGLPRAEQPWLAGVWRRA